MNKKERQELIVDIITSQAIHTQQELMKALQGGGVHATQATISRDITELGLVKEHLEDGRARYSVYKEPEPERLELELEKMIHGHIKSITQVQFLVVMHTELGSADMVAALLDEKDYPEIAGTVAGKDTLVIIAKDVASANQINTQFLKWLE